MTDRSCTCHPDDNPPVPCAQKFALTDCRAAHAAALEADARRYRYLRDRDLETIHMGGIFAGRVPENLVVNGDDLDAAIDWAMSPEA